MAEDVKPAAALEPAPSALVAEPGEPVALPACPFCEGEAEYMYVPRQATWADGKGYTREGVVFARLPAGHVYGCKICGGRGPVVTDDYLAVKELHKKLGLQPTEYVLAGHDGAGAIQDAAKSKAADAWRRRAAPPARQDGALREALHDRFDSWWRKYYDGADLARGAACDAWCSAIDAALAQSAAPVQPEPPHSTVFRVEQDGTGLFIGTSPQFHGLLVAKTSLLEAIRAIPDALEALILASPVQQAAPSDEGE